MRKVTLIRALVLVFTALMVLTQSAGQVFAAGPSYQGTITASPGNASSGAPSAAWLALKNDLRIRSGVSRNQAKGTVAHMYVSATPAQVRPLPTGSTYAITGCTGSTVPCSDELSTANPVPNVYEPGAGCTSNYGSGTAHTDDANKGYCADSNFFALCGPGAADVAMYYWPKPYNGMDKSNVVDPKTGVSTTWNGMDVDGTYRYRGYMAYLAFQLKASGWSQPGLMEQYSGGGVRLQELEQAMNYEETGEGSIYGFYVVEWHYDSTYNTGGGTASTFHSDVTSDIYNSSVPVVAEVNAQLLPNWPNKGGQTLHFISIIGYNDSALAPDGTYGEYYYTDTCGSSTGCGSYHDAGVNVASYNQMWNAIMGAPYSPNTGDGGWIW